MVANADDTKVLVLAMSAMRLPRVSGEVHMRSLRPGNLGKSVGFFMLSLLPTHSFVAVKAWLDLGVMDVLPTSWLGGIANFFELRQGRALNGMESDDEALSPSWPHQSVACFELGEGRALKGMDSNDEAVSASWSGGIMTFLGCSRGGAPTDMHSFDEARSEFGRLDKGWVEVNDSPVPSR
mmetsp:Transcript_1804/g.5112  ORF Transcript_1804/g.5112 Transcript_1804/m.5112 type:complete len:181 (+) Transcript_1804:519-1061(+)